MPTFSETFAAPAWIVKHTDDADAANMRVALRKMIVSTAGDSIDVTFPVHVSIPALTNPKKLKDGDELFLLRDAPAKASQPAKRALNLQVEAPKANAKAAIKKK